MAAWFVKGPVQLRHGMPTFGADDEHGDAGFEFCGNMGFGYGSSSRYNWSAARSIVNTILIIGEELYRQRYTNYGGEVVSS